MTWFDELPRLVQLAIEGLALVIILTVILQIVVALLVGFVAWRESKSQKRRAELAARRSAAVRRRHGLDN